jgi:hypothetical protein
MVMSIRRFIPFILILFCFQYQKAQLPLVRDTITVIEGGNVLKSAWAGGLNFCSVSQVDLDMDSKLDLVLFDKVDIYAYGIFRCFLNKGGVGQTKYVHAPQYSANFPQVQQWAIFFDYNQDSKADLFTYTLGGIKVFRNTSSAGNLSFKLEKPALRSNITPTNSPFYTLIYSSPVSIPGFSDIDNDGDIDVLTFSSSGVNMEYHKNMSQETYGHSDSLIYELEEYTWGDVTESNCIVDLNQYITGGPTDPYLQKVYHSGSCLMCMDRDGDGDKDLIMGDISCSYINYCENTGSITNAHISDTTKLYPNYPNKASTPVVRMSQFPCTYNVDINNDGKKDLLASPNVSGSQNYNSVWFYQNASTTPTVDFQFVKNNFLQEDMIELGEGAYPAMIDVDNDGLLDLIVGNHGYYTGTTNFTKIAYYRNIGTASMPSYSLITRDFANISSYVTTYTLNGLVPAAGDIDGDGDVDIILAEQYGKFHKLENTAGPGNPCNFSVFSYNSFSITPLQAWPYPQVIDVDRDGDLDFLVGIKSGKLAYYKNTGTVTSPTFTLITNSFGNVNVKDNSGLYTDGSCAPFMYDEGGVYKLLCGSVSGRIFLYGNIDGNLSGNFNRLDTNVNLINEGPNSTLQYIDINNDGKRDLIVGNYAGGLAYYSSNGPGIGINELSNIENELLVYPNPANDYFEIKSLNNFTDKLVVELYDVIGKKIVSQTTLSNSTKLNCENLQQGIYLMRVTVVAGKTSKTIIKKVILD